MRTVIITYTNGENVRFPAQEFDIPTVELPSSGRSTLKKFSYKDENGEESAVYLQPGEVAGIVVVAQ